MIFGVNEFYPEMTTSIINYTTTTLIRLCGTVKLHNLLTWTRVIYCLVLCQWNEFDCPQNHTLTDHLHVVQCTYCNNHFD